MIVIPHALVYRHSAARASRVAGTVVVSRRTLPDTGSCGGHPRRSGPTAPLHEGSPAERLNGDTLANALAIYHICSIVTPRTATHRLHTDEVSQGVGSSAYLSISKLTWRTI
jgi:hypothetical protein